MPASPDHIEATLLQIKLCCIIDLPCPWWLSCFCSPSAFPWASLEQGTHWAPENKRNSQKNDKTLHINSQRDADVTGHTVVNTASSYMKDFVMLQRVHCSRSVQLTPFATLRLTGGHRRRLPSSIDYNKLYENNSSQQIVIRLGLRLAHIISVIS